MLFGLLVNALIRVIGTFVFLLSVIRRERFFISLSAAEQDTSI